MVSSGPRQGLQGGTQAMPYNLLSYQAGQAARAGMLVGDTVYDAAKATGLAAHSTVLGVLHDWSRGKRLPALAAKRLESGKGRGQGEEPVCPAPAIDDQERRGHASNPVHAAALIRSSPWRTP